MGKGRKLLLRIGDIEKPISITNSNHHILRELNDITSESRKMCRMRNVTMKLAKFYSLKEHFEAIKKRFNENNYCESERDLFSNHIDKIEFVFTEFSTFALPELKRQAEAELKRQETEAKIKEEAEAKIKEVKKPRKRRHSSKNHSNVKKIKL